MEIENPWGLVIIFSAFMIQVVAFGYSFAWGIYIVELLSLYQTSAWILALIGSVNIGIFLGAGPLVSLMMRFLSYRKVALIGAALSSLGMLIMPFTPAIELLLLFYGVMAGLGYCMLYIPSHVLSGLYYNKHRSLATGIATAGSGLGSIVYPLLTQYLINVYGWRGSMLILAGINMNTFWLSGLLRPAPVQVRTKGQSEKIHRHRYQPTLRW
ncbi:hypothetical protein FSP39_017020 [Pinctada imbricata]|uniref:Major facilitator superfamily (MFS) profile domain-containing protein n=1 Tax=Pinctada imbricata TaxID=66713 RepID=A0AA88XZG0_PINIB|nr:hypothetical protein FSP39_017020 [Pinctada imbricata]